MSSPIPSKLQTPSSFLGLTSLNRSGFEQPVYSTSMPQSGRRPQHQKQTSRRHLANVRFTSQSGHARVASRSPAQKVYILHKKLSLSGALCAKPARPEAEPAIRAVLRIAARGPARHAPENLPTRSAPCPSIPQCRAGPRAAIRSTARIAGSASGRAPDA